MWPAARWSSADGVLESVGDATLVAATTLLLGAGRRGRLVGELAGFRRELLQQAALAGAEARGHLHLDQHVEVAPNARPTQVRHAAATKPDLGTRLGTGLDLDQL